MPLTNIRYNPKMADLFTEVYNWLPLCHLINEKVLVRALLVSLLWLN